MFFQLSDYTKVQNFDVFCLNFIKKCSKFFLLDTLGYAILPLCMGAIFAKHNFKIGNIDDINFHPTLDLAILKFTRTIVYDSNIPKLNFDENLNQRINHFKTVDFVGFGTTFGSAKTESIKRKQIVQLNTTVIFLTKMFDQIYMFGHDSKNLGDNTFFWFHKIFVTLALRYFEGCALNKKYKYILKSKDDANGYRVVTPGLL